MTRAEALEKLISVRHYCFLRGVLDCQDGFNAAFRDLNRLHVALKCQIAPPAASVRKRKGRGRHHSATTQLALL
jgi:hypothetical protein